VTDSLAELRSILPARLLRELQKLARKYYEDGISLFIFGSFARGDPRPTSDLDLGVEWHTERNPRTFSRLYWDVQELPTVREIDLVDFGQVDANFRRVAGTNKAYLYKRGDSQP